MLLQCPPREYNDRFWSVSQHPTEKYSLNICIKYYHRLFASIEIHWIDIWLFYNDHVVECSIASNAVSQNFVMQVGNGQYDRWSKLMVEVEEPFMQIMMQMWIWLK
jgi:hypothetical protein